VLQLLALGKTNAEIACHMFVETTTVKTHEAS
jgi:DNA-binding NarL/FixJ family response regulator